MSEPSTQFPPQSYSSSFFLNQISDEEEQADDQSGNLDKAELNEQPCTLFDCFSKKMSSVNYIFLILLIYFLDTTEAMQCTRAAEPQMRTFETLPSYQGNKITFDPTQSNYLGNFVRILKIKSNLEKNDFISYTSNYIIRLILTNKNITTIENATFTGLYCLESLELQNNKIATINSGSFDYVQHLRYLNLSYNSIETIASNSFENLTHLISLDLSFNRIKQFTAISTQLTLLNFQYFNISNNELLNFNLSNFSKTPSIKFLDLSYNLLTKLPIPTKIIYEKLTRLMVHENNLSNLQMFNFKTSMPHLAYLTLEGNNWDCVDLTYILKILRESNIMADSLNKTTTNIAGIDCRMGIHTTLPPLTSAPGEIGDETKHFDELKYNQTKVLQSIVDLKYVITYLFVFIILFVIFDITIKAGCLDYIRVWRNRRQPLFDDANIENLRLLSTQRL